MRGMDNGPGTPLGSLGWFVAVWTVMMAAMMLPSLSPTAALYSRITRSRAPIAPLLFTSGYIATWAAAGLLAFAISDAAHRLLGAQISWERGGRWVAGAILLAAAAYELTPLKNVCLGKCRSPLGSLLGSWRPEHRGALHMGARHGLWCVGCCWALMAALFALGVMSLAWMALVAALIAAEKLLPNHRAVTYTTAALLLTLAILLTATPNTLPWLTIPGNDPPEMSRMNGM
jgi:predicted metal-binding membrane protein